MNRLIPLLVGMLLIGGLFAGCGTDEQSDGAAVTADADKRKEAAERKADLKDAQKRAADARVVADECEQQMGRLLKRTRALNSRLDIGLNYDEYSDQVADLKVAYDAIDFGGAGDDSLKCLSSVGVPLEGALNQYVKSYRTWNACFEDYDCDNDSITPQLQARWSKATRQVSHAARGLSDLTQDAIHAQDEVDRLEEDR